MASPSPFYAAVDLGSNAFRMMIGQQVVQDKKPVIQKVETLREPVRLSEGLQGMALDTPALERGWRALERFGKRLRGFEAGRVRAVATNTVRVAENAAEFLAEAEQRLGFRIDVISGHEEARLVYAGIAHAMPDPNTTRLVVDIGGGSTELIVGRGDTPLLMESVPIGSGVFSKRYFADGRITSHALQLAEMTACDEIGKVAHRYREHAWQQAIGSSGTARMLAKVLKANGLHDSAGGITYQGLLRLSVRMLEAGRIEQLKLSGLQAERSSTLPGGVAVMLAAFKVLGIDEMMTSEPGLRLGVLHSLMHQKVGTLLQ
ncbi:Ppx/GppA family phosphatase [Crenobacter sp. SG2303]|uniref:Ppx/GppA family phosphatase n=1 Tax=Crenobacter oryzisoli TaxID=3056844 RepID=A0ABT7XI73_9NEIS|nr:Ppx/GppA family phosphatase [Crenobacter sp. SG2303]MDN0073472.1 Ppx/GppA family phosphatase [Crenobacter sp. SG2303]